MTTQELILGHFEQALTPQEENLLQQQLGASPEARAMYEQHRTLNGHLNNDAMALAPSSRLDEMTLAAALSVVPEVIAGSSTAWFSGKMIATFAAVIVGGTSIALLTTSGPKQDAAPIPAANAPAVRTLPAAPAQATPPPAPTSEPAATTSRSATPAAAERPTAKAPAAAIGQKARETSKPSLRMPTGASKIDNKPTIKRFK